MSNFKTLWSIKLHFASRWTKSDEIDVAFCFSGSKVVWQTLWRGLLSIKLHFGLSSCTLVYQVASWSIKLHLGLSSCILVYQVAFWSIKLHLASRIKLHLGLSSCTWVYQVALGSIKLHLVLSSCILVYPWTKSDKINVAFCFSGSKVRLLPRL